MSEMTIVRQNLSCPVTTSDFNSVFALLAYFVIKLGIVLFVVSN